MLGLIKIYHLFRMNQLVRYIIIGFVVALIAFLVWYFSSIVAYILISAVLSLMGKPIVDFISGLKIKGWHPPRFIGAFVALATIWLLFIAFFRVMIPLVIAQFNELGSIDVQSLVASFNEPINAIQHFIQDYLPSSAQEFILKDFLIQKISGIFTISMISDAFSSTANVLINLLIALFSISFITFFFLKDDTLFFKSIILIFPERFEGQITRALTSINKLLRRYFIGIIIESTGILTLITIGLSIIGVKFQTAIVVGLIAGIMNVVPYVGPLTGTVLGTLIVLATKLHSGFSSDLLTLSMLTLLVFLTTQLIDNIVFQPTIYGNSVKAHPLEIFIVLLIAGSVAGILGMLLAIPSYTVIRVFAKEFFNNFRVVQKLTEKI
ncbi:AI-2E family transporter [Tenuifilum thalassicum]|uniref:AI-2E family transporter n=1 Tax=Tenuifilum thalassicum TaxID=2590900 RepID=A0A7D3XUC4_9BACT|nr:AI-2E family transporter [Tenuifilum thalassicum]QKG78928.1 AI-2E family transporter [Tenuifilum thalassicum]